MPSFVDKRDTKTIQAPWWAEKEYCEIRRYGFGDRQTLANRAWKLGLIKKDDAANQEIAELAVGTLNLVVLELGIVRWTDSEGVLLPVTIERIKQLDEEDGDYILNENNEFNPSRQRSAEDQANFRGADRDRDQE